MGAGVRIIDHIKRFLLPQIDEPVEKDVLEEVWDQWGRGYYRFGRNTRVTVPMDFDQPFVRFDWKEYGEHTVIGCDPALIPDCYRWKDPAALWETTDADA